LKRAGNAKTERARPLKKRKERGTLKGREKKGLLFHQGRGVQFCGVMQERNKKEEEI